MASSKMIQLYVEQQYASHVQDVYALDAEAYLFVDPSKDTVVREIDSEKYGGILASKAPGAFPFAVPSGAFVTVRLVPPRGEETELYGPSQVASPPISGIGLVVLRAAETGISIGDPGQLSLARAIGAHVYVDQA